MKHIFFSLIISLITFVSAGQKHTFSGIIKDRETGETLIGANVLVKQGVGTVTDYEGKFSIDLDAGSYKIQISYVGFEQITKEIELDKDMFLVFNMKAQTLDEVSIVADVARERETPVAFTNVLPAKIEEELGAQDLPMVLNSTPGVYATQQGGGDGDARVSIRGFNQRNIAVLLDGIPVNDMENGWVYWSNWFGLDAVTRSMQVQRGLSASKLTIPSVGGTINIITKGIENKKEIVFKQEVDGEGKLRTSLGYTSGKLKNGWGITLAGSYKNGEGYVDQTWTKAYFYYAKIDKRIGNHILSLSAMGAPQEHSQRSYKRAIATYDSTYAVGLGVDTFPAVVDKGLRYNQQWGEYTEWEYGPNIVDSLFQPPSTYLMIYDTIWGDKKRVNYKVNQYHKPAFSLRDFWTINDKLYVSNILYLSIGRGGGTDTKVSLKDSDLDENGQIKWQRLYDANRSRIGVNSAIVPYYSETLYRSSNYRVMNVNEHMWYGALSTLNYTLNDAVKLSGGLDLRSYRGTHYRKVYDLLGGDYCIDNFDANQDTVVKMVGDKVYFYDDAWVKWGGMFGQLEYTDGLWAVFGNISVARTGNKKEDYFKAPDSPIRKTDWLWKTSYTFKGGANYNLSEHSNIFMNLGYLSKTRSSTYIYDGYDAKFRENTDNELVKAIELGYSYHNSSFAYNLNLYSTAWQNQPINDIPIGQDSIARISGINQLHQGVEFDFIYKINRQIEFEGLASVGNWIYQSKEENVRIYDRDNGQSGGTFNFDSRGVHVGDAAQTQFMGSIRYEPIKRLYLNFKYIYFDRHYADFSPSALNGEGAAIDEDGNPSDSWRIPTYGLVDFHTGYTFYVNDYRMSIRLSVLNVLNKQYISDALTDDQYIYGTPNTDTFGVNSTSVFIGLGRRFNTSVSITF